MRYLLLYALGGAYFDVKADVTRPLDSIILPGDRIILSPYQGTHDSAVLSLPRDQQPSPLPGEYITWYLVFAAGHPVLRAVIDEVVRRMVNYSTFRDGVGAPATFWVTGPVAFNTAANRALAAHPHRLLLHEADASIRFSIYSQPNLHQLRQGRHYSTLRRPLMLRGAVETAATIGFFRLFYPIRRRLQLHR
jgi:hypothetical protein